MKRQYEVTLYNYQEWMLKQTRHQAENIEATFGVQGFARDLVIKTNGRGYRSYGGIRYYKNVAHPFVSFSEKSVYRRVFNGKGAFLEYRSIAKDSVIGNYNGTLEGALIALIIHELGHAFDYWLMGEGKEYKETVEKTMMKFPKDRRTKSKGGHGDRWKGIYGTLRSKFLNGGYSTVPVAKLSEPKAEKKKREYKKEVISQTLVKRRADGFVRKAYALSYDRTFMVIAEQDWKGGMWYVRVTNTTTKEYYHVDFKTKYGDYETDGRKLRGFAKKVLEEAVALKKEGRAIAA
jgi:hypothetical protein